jgi:uncharacterized RDD family membrane protein YckC
MARRSRQRSRLVQPEPPSSREVVAGLSATALRAGLVAGRVVLVPARAVGRASVRFGVSRTRAEQLAAAGREATVESRRLVDDIAAEVLAAPEMGRVADLALAGPLPEAVAESLVTRDVVRRVVAALLAQPGLAQGIEDALDAAATHRLVEEVLGSPAFERLLRDTLESALTADLTDRILQSPEFERSLERVLSSPAVRAALAKQSRGLLDELGDNAAASLARADDAVERRLHRPATGATSYGGVVSRGIALGLDVAFAQIAFLVGAGFVGVIASLVGGIHPHWVKDVLAAIGWPLIVGGYFVAFWSGAGQTPGMRLFRLRVVASHGERPGAGRSAVRLLGLALSVVLLFLGFVPALFDSRRRALQDFLAGTAVSRAPR